MMFASKSPRDLLLTDEDWAAINRGDYCEEELVGIIPSKFHNAPNTILVDIRKYHSERQGMNNPKSWDHYLRVFESATRGGYPFVTADWGRITSEEHIDHARLVLTRLAALTKEQA